MIFEIGEKKQTKIMVCQDSLLGVDVDVGDGVGVRVCVVGRCHFWRQACRQSPLS